MDNQIFDPNNPQDVEALIRTVADFPEELRGAAEGSGDLQHQAQVLQHEPQIPQHGPHVPRQVGKRVPSERKAREEGILIPVAFIVEADIDDLRITMKNEGYNDQQVQLCRDIRRKGRNKVAAQNCRRRKRESVERLRGKVQGLKQERLELERQRESLRLELDRWQAQVNAASKTILAGLGLSDDSSSLVLADEDIVIVHKH